jgi:trimeric autotransporter adhesin
MYRQSSGKTLRLLRKAIGLGAFIVVTFLLMAGACGGNPPQDPSLSVSPPSLTASIGGSAQTFTATLTNSTDTVNWSLAGAGSISATTGETTSYTPPATGGASTATLTATAGSLSQSVIITITAAGAPSLSISPLSPTTTVGGGAIGFTATLTNSTESPNDIAWVLTGGGGGSLTLASGPFTSYTPPATGSGGTATLTASVGALSASTSITVNDATVPTLIVDPKTRELTVGGVTVVFTAALTNSSATINWTLSGAGSIPANSTGNSVSYTPPATGGATTATLTATAGALSDSASITVNAQSVTTITVTGKVLNFDGTAAAGVAVQIDDSATTVIAPAATLSGTSGGDGSFSISGVKVPYTLSIIPNDNINAPQSWTGVTRADPTVVINPLAGPSAFCTSPAPGLLNVNFPAAGAGNLAVIVFVAPGINQFELASNVLVAAAAGATTTTLTVPFDTSLCQTTVSGKVLYFEIDGTNVPVKTASVNATVITGNTQTVNITPQTALTQSLGGTITFPTGTTTTSVDLIAKVGSASVNLQITQTVTSVLPTYEFAAPVIPGVQYYVIASGNNDAANNFQWSTSEAISALPAVVNLSLPNSVQTNQPSGAKGTDATPAFSYTSVVGTNLYSTLLLDALTGGTVTTWLGQTSGTSLTIPSLPAPARLDVGTDVAPTAFIWFVNAIRVRVGGDSDTMLDGRQVKKFYIGAGLGDILGILNPDVISSGSVNLVTTTFTLP